MRVDVAEAQERFEEFVAVAESGTTVVFTRDGEPVVRLEPIESDHRAVRLGRLAGEISLGDDFDDPLDGFDA